MGWLIAAGVLALIAMLPIGVSALYNAEGPLIYAVLGPIRLRLYPAIKKDTKPKERKPKKQKTVNSTTNKKETKKKGGSLQEFLPVLDRALDFLNAFRRKLRVTCLELKLIWAGSDPSDLAVNYGRGWAVLGNLLPLLEKVLVIKKRDLEVECDFLAEKTTIIAQLDVSITVGRLLLLLVVSGIPVLRELIKFLNKRKGGAKA